MFPTEYDRVHVVQFPRPSAVSWISCIELFPLPHTRRPSRTQDTASCRPTTLCTRSSHSNLHN